MCTPSTPRPTAALSRHPTPATSVTQEVPIDTSPGVQSSRQSNDINVVADTFDATTTEDNVHEEQACDLDQGKQYGFPIMLSSITYLLCHCYSNTLSFLLQM
jgi:hypothetical protein